MKQMKVGLRLESLGLPLRKALAAAQRIGVGGVQVDALGDLAPDALTLTGRRELRNLLRAHDLEITAVGCPLRKGLDVAEDQQPRLEHVRKVMQLSFDLGPRVVVVEAGPLPDLAPDALEAPAARLMRESLLDLSGHGDRTGTVVALETGLEPGRKMADYLATFDTGSLAANLDPANLLLHGFDPYEAIAALSGRLAHVHARDARGSSASRHAAEVPLGHGDIDWLRFVELLAQAEYRGWLCVERQGGEDRLGEVERGVGFLRRLV